MSEEAIRKLKLKFIIYAMLSLSIVMFLMGGMIYVTNLLVSRNEIRETMQYIIRHEGDIQDAVILYDAQTEEAKASDSVQTEDEGEMLSDRLKTTNADSSSADSENAGKAASDPNGQQSKQEPDAKTDAAQGKAGANAGQHTELKERLEQMNQSFRENPYNIHEFLGDVFGTGSGDDVLASEDDSFSTRFFAVIYDEDGTVCQIKANHISLLTSEDAQTLGDYARNKLFRFGQCGKYYYQVQDLEDGRGIVIFLDATNQIHSTVRLFYSALLLIAFGICIAFLFVSIFSGKAIAPEIRNAELQKQFITNASHELKTPLAVIRANTEMQEILGGENEWTQSTLRQVDRLSGLIQNLVVITRAQEKETEERVAVNAAALIRDTAKTYQPVALQEGKAMDIDLPETLTMKAVDSEIRQLTTLLIDNAIKYCDPKGSIRVQAGQKGRETWLVVSNSYREGKDVDYSRFFERFYRQNEAHTIGEEKDQKSGYGIGLSIAENLVKKYNGTIKADWKDGVIYFTCTLR